MTESCRRVKWQTNAAPREKALLYGAYYTRCNHKTKNIGWLARIVDWTKWTRWVWMDSPKIAAHHRNNWKPRWLEGAFMSLPLSLTSWKWSLKMFNEAHKLLNRLFIFCLLLMKHTGEGKDGGRKELQLTTELVVSRIWLARRVHFLFLFVSPRGLLKIKSERKVNNVLDGYNYLHHHHHQQQQNRRQWERGN